ncbi:sodium:solute symporter [Xanthomarina sp. F1114]|uniref:sodium:solute symporter family transporter n=1 Tax=Xanthomarina sp. F1114 TaxID=2996019 RepID=UPI00225E1749|nr:sodium:solute symporter [Xanthomarina sp. F1114]MCX7548932.1 sodium:solute symporter [Xanthomarina sp. F1114]
MSISLVTSILLVLYMALILFFVIRGALRTKSLEDYAVGTGSSPIVVGLSLAASVTSAATFIINPGFVAMYGWSAFFALSVVMPVGLFLSLIIMTKSFQKIGHTTKALTLAQWIGNRFNNKLHSRIIAFLSLLLITFIVLICVGIVKVLTSALGISELYVLLGLVLFVFGYTMFGGANSMIKNNAIQAVMISIVAVILLFSGYQYFDVGLSGFWEKINAIDPMLTQKYNPESPLFRDFFEVVVCNFIIGIAIVCQPHIITRSLMLRSEKDTNKYLITSILVLILFFSVLIVGLYARLQMPDLMQDGVAVPLDSIVSVYVVNRFTPYLGVIVIFGLLAAGLSTLEGLVQSLSTTITNDIILPLTKKDYSENKKKKINRWVIVALAIVTILMSYDQLVDPNLSVGIFAQNGVYMFFSAAFVPVLFGIFLKHVPSQAPLFATLTSIVVYVAVYYGGLTEYTSGPVRNPAVAGALAILASLFVGGISYLLLKKKIKLSENVA